MRRVEALLLAVNQRFGATMILTSHHVESTLRIADHVVVLVDGAAARGRAAEIRGERRARVREFFADAGRGRPVSGRRRASPGSARRAFALRPRARPLARLRGAGRGGARDAARRASAAPSTSSTTSACSRSPIIGVSGLAVGMVLGLQGYNTLVRFGAEESLGTVVGLSLIRELGPGALGAARHRARRLGGRRRDRLDGASPSSSTGCA